MSRLPDLKPEDMDEKQKAVFSKSGAAARGGQMRGPSYAMLFSPELAERAQSFNEFVVKQNSFGMRLTELAILVTARHVSSRVEWWVHAPAAAKHGIKADVIEAIRTGRQPSFDLDDEKIVYAFAVELHRNRAVSSATYDRAVKLLGLKGTVELVGLLGCYTMLAMVIGAFELEPPENTLGD
jgi:4-carboxymuconolactone decarboxylase